MFGKGNWVTKLLVEGEKDAQLVSRIERLPEADPRFENYPVEIKLKKKRSFWQAVKVAVDYAGHNIYSMVYKDKRENQGEAQKA